MQIKIKKSSFDSVINLISSYLDKKDQSSINACILLEANDDLLISATDEEVGLRYKISDANILQKGIICINGLKFSNILKGLKEGDILIKADECDLFIKQSKSSYKIPLINYEMFYKFPTIENKSKFQTNSLAFSKNLKRILPCIDTNNPKIDMNGALIDIFEDHLNLVATDGRRLAIIELDQKSSKRFSLIIPRKAIVEINKIFFNDVEIFYDKNIFLAVGENFEFFTKLINSKFQDYLSIIPKEAKEIIKLNRDSFLEAIKSINVISDKTKISFSKEKIEFEDISEGNGAAKHEINMEFDIKDEFCFGINNKFMIDFLSNITTEEFILEFNQSNAPIMLKSENFKTLVMPVMI